MIQINLIILRTKWIRQIRKIRKILKARLKIRSKKIKFLLKEEIQEHQEGHKKTNLKGKL